MMSAGGKVAKLPKDKMTKANPASQNGKAEANRNQPTAEQLRLAQITSDKTDKDPEIAEKVTQICELTGQSKDEVMTALYDCDYDANRAVEKLLESKEDSVDEWQVIDKKKKMTTTSKVSPAETPSDLKLDIQTEQETDQNHTDSAPRGRRDRPPPRFTQGRGRGAGYPGPDRNDRSRENTSREREQGFESSRGRRRGNFGESRGRGSRRGGRSMHSNKFETQIDTWTNESAQNGNNDTHIGSWTDNADDWTADEWNGSLNESCVFIPSSSSRSAAMYSLPHDASDGKVMSSVHENMNVAYESSSHQMQGTASGDKISAAERTSFSGVPPQTKTNSGEVSTSQQYVAKEPTAAELADVYGSVSDRTMYVSHYNKEATECLKSVMGIGRNSLSQTTSNVDEISRTAGQPLVNLQQSSQLQRVKQARPRLPPPSKIPSMPVEMPDSMNSGRLDVQFGNWDVTPLATDSNISFMSDIITSPEYISTTLISSSQSSSVSGSGTATQPAVTSFVSTPETSATTVLKPSSFHTALPPVSSTDSSLLKVVSMSSSSSSGLLTSVSKAGVSVSSQLGFNQMVYSSSSTDGVASAGPKLPISNGPGHYGNLSYQSGVASLATMSSDYNLSQEQMQYSYGDTAQRFGVSGPPSQPGYGPTPLPPGYNSGPLPNQLHYNTSQGPVKMFHLPEKQPTGSYSVSSEIVGMYQSAGDKQGVTFSASLSQSYDSAAGYQSVAGFQGGNQTSGTSLHYPGVASGLSFQGMQMESGGFETGQYPSQSVYRQRDSQASYDIGGTESQRISSTTGTSQSFSSSFVSHGQVAQSSSSSFNQNQGMQSTSTAYVPQGQGSSLYGGQRQGTPSAGSAFGSHGQGSSQTYGSQVQGSQSATTTVVPSGITGGLVSSTTVSGKLGDSLSKLNLKDGQQGESGNAVTSADTASSLASSSLTSASSIVTSTVTSVTTLASKASSVATSKSSMSQTSKPLLNIPPGMPAAAATATMLNHNYMIGQPPGFQVAAFSYPATQQPVPYSYEELQLLQQRFSLPYYDVNLQTSAALPSRESSSASLGAQSYTGNEIKMAAVDVLSPVNAQPTQQPQAVTGNQQAYMNHAFHPSYGYYYPGAASLLPVPPYYPVVPMAIPSVTSPASVINPATNTTQYQKMFGSHTYGGQTQDFTKAFGGSQVPSKPSAGVATGIGGTSGDLMSGVGTFGKTQHIQAYERGGYHTGTPPPPFSMASAGGTQAGALGAPAMYGPPYMPIVPHQQSHSQLLHHAIPQESAVAGRAAQPIAVQPKVGGNKPYGNAYWGSN